MTGVPEAQSPVFPLIWIDVQRKTRRKQASQEPMVVIWMPKWPDGSPLCGQDDHPVGQGADLFPLTVLGAGAVRQEVYWVVWLSRGNRKVKSLLSEKRYRLHNMQRNVISHQW